MFKKCLLLLLSSLGLFAANSFPTGVGFNPTNMTMGPSGLINTNYNTVYSSNLNGGLIATGTTQKRNLVDIAADDIYIDAFNVSGDGIADDTAKFRLAFDLIKSKGGGTITLGKNKVYNLGSVTNSYPFYSFTNLSGVTINGNGSTLYTGTGTNYGTFLQFTGCTNTEIKNLNFKSGYAQLDNTRGQEWLAFRQGCVEVKMENLNFNYGAIGFTCRGSIYTDGGSDTNRTRNITALGLSFSGTYYPLNFQGAGDNFFGRGIKTINSGRAYFPSNVKNHDLVLDGTQGGPFSDVLLKVYGSTNVYSGLENIKLVYNTNGRYLGSGNEAANDTLVQMEAQIFNNSDLTNGSFCGFTNIDLTINYHGSASDKDQGIFSIKKFLPDGSADLTGRGHTISGLSVRGVWSGLENILNQPFDIFGWSSDSWTGDQAQGIYLNIQLFGDYNKASVIDGRAFTITNAPSIIVDNTTAHGYLAMVNFTNALSYGLFKNVHFTNINSTLNALSYLNGAATTGMVVTLQSSAGNLVVGGPTILSNSLQVAGHVQINNHQINITDNDVLNTGSTFGLRQDSTNAYIDANIFTGSNYKNISIQTKGSERMFIQTNGDISFKNGSSVFLTGETLTISSSLVSSTGKSLNLSHNGTNSIIESSFFSGGYTPLMFRTGGTNQMWLTTDGILVMTNAIRLPTGDLQSQLNLKGITNILSGTNTLVVSNTPGVFTINYSPVTNCTTIAVSDTTTTLSSGVSKQYWNVPFAASLKDIRATLSTISSSGLVTVNIKKNGTTIFTTKLTIDASEETSDTAATPYIFSTTSLTKGDKLTFDIDTAGTGAINLQVQLYYTRP